MNAPDVLTPAKAAYRLTHILNTFAAAHSGPRFPIDVASLALGAADIFGWNDPITDVRAESMPRFEGALIGADRTKWMLLYNDRLLSPGRIRFTQAHELGHYMLHRALRDAFGCTERDMTDWSDEADRIETEADEFASTLLMPLDDFRQQTKGASGCFEVLGDCANRYGVSLTAAALRWLQFTEEAAVLVVHRDGFMDWSFSSKAAMKAGAFFRTRREPVAIPVRSLAGDDGVPHERTGKQCEAHIWFPDAERGVTMRECKITADQYDSVMTLLVLGRGEKVWKPWDDR